MLEVQWPTQAKAMEANCFPLSYSKLIKNIRLSGVYTPNKYTQLIKKQKRLGAPKNSFFYKL